MVCACVCVFVLVFEPLVEFGEAHVGAELLEKDLDEDPAGRRCGLLTHPDTLQHLVETQEIKLERKTELSLVRLEWI